MAVVMRLSRRGKKNAPFYHVVVADEKKPRDGDFLEVLGTYDPGNKEKRFVGKKDRIEYWLSKGARPSETISQLLRTLK
ncbi:MAG: 30S ribosomal protein S16 [Pseudomonadota bacterium]